MGMSSKERQNVVAAELSATIRESGLVMDEHRKTCRRFNLGLDFPSAGVPLLAAEVDGRPLSALRREARTIICNSRGRDHVEQRLSGKISQWKLLRVQVLRNSWLMSARGRWT